MKASVFGNVYPIKIQAVLDEYQAGEPILGRLVQGKCGDILVIGRVVNAYRTSDIINEYTPAKHISKQQDLLTAQALLHQWSGVILEIDLITALKDGKRVTLNFLLEHLSEVHFLEDFPVKQTPHTGYLGSFYGSEIKAPFILQDFQTLREAYHFFITGQTGSGKSTLAQMLLALYHRKNPNMSFLILDTVGEFTASFEKKGDMFLHLKDVWKGKVEIYTPPENLALEGWDIFKEICLEYDVMKIIDIPAISAENTDNGISAIVDMLKERINMLKVKDNRKSTEYLTPNIVESTLKSLAIDEQLLDKFVKKVYKSSEPSRDRIRNAIRDPQTLQLFIKKIKDVAELFCTVNTNKKIIQDVVKDFSELAVNGKSGKCVVLNFTLEKTGFDTKHLRSKYVRETLKALYSEGIKLYSQRGNINLNTLVVLEEAHNYAPKYPDDEELKNLSNDIVRYFIETRKFGIGWCCITTSPSNVRREIFENTRVRFIGPGLTSGPNAELLRENFGSEILNLYKLLPDPSDPLSPKKEINFIVSGPITLLSREKPDFITIFNDKNEFLKINGFQV